MRQGKHIGLRRCRWLGHRFAAYPLGRFRFCLRCYGLTPMEYAQ